MTTRVGLSTESPNGGDRRWLNQYGEIAGLKYSKAYPGGDDKLTCTLRVPPGSRNVAWAPGRRLKAWVGASNVWTGTLDQPDTSARDGVNLSASGAITDAQTYLAVSPHPDGVSSPNALFVDRNIDAAIARGLPWRRILPGPTSFGYLAPGCDLKTALDKLAEMTGSYWYVFPDGLLTWSTPRIDTTHLLFASGQGGARTLDGYASDVYAIYQKVGATDTAAWVKGPSSAPLPRLLFGRRESLVDLTGQDQLSDLQVQSVLDVAITKTSYRTSWTQPLNALPGQLCNPRGQTSDTALLRPGDRVRAVLSDVDAGGEQPGRPVEFVVGATAFDGDTDSVQITPMDTVRKDLVGRLGQLPQGTRPTP